VSENSRRKLVEVPFAHIRKAHRCLPNGAGLRTSKRACNGPAGV